MSENESMASQRRHDKININLQREWIDTHTQSTEIGQRMGGSEKQP